MLKSGLVSITFRNLDTDTIIEIVKKAGIDAIEWGGDVHVPHGDIEKAKEVYEKCTQNNISCPSYGSYYKLGTYKNPEQEFKKVYDCAKELHCETIRVWAGEIGTDKADKKHWNKIIHEAQMICDIAKDMTISFEYHRNTLTDNIDSTLDLLKKVEKGNIYSYWQPEVGMTYENNIKVLNKILPYVTNIHVFKWSDTDRLPLTTGKDEWSDYLKLANTLAGPHYCMIEFVKSETIDQFYEDAKILKEILETLK